MVEFGEYRGGPMHPNDVDDAPDKVIEAAEKRLQEIGTVPKIEAPETAEVEEEELNELEEEENSTEIDEESEETIPEEGSDESEEIAKEAEESATDDEPAIPENLYRAAEHSKWKPEEIVDFWKANPEMAEKTFEKMRQDMVEVNKQFSENGRARKQVAQERAEHPASTQTPVKPKSFVDVDKARVEFGDGAAELIGQMNQVLVQQADEIAEIKSTAASPRTQEAANQDRSLAVATQITNFFGHANMKAYEDFYGPSVDANGTPYSDWDHLTAGQEANRSAVMTEAADIQSGVAIRGTDITVSEAMARAHMIATDGIKTETIRSGIIKSVKKKAKGVTLRPTKTKVKPKAPKLKRGEKMTESKVYSTAKARLANMVAGKPMS
jgi:hypothetical protein